MASIYSLLGILTFLIKRKESQNYRKNIVYTLVIISMALVAAFLIRKHFVEKVEGHLTTEIEKRK